MTQPMLAPETGTAPARGETPLARLGLLCGEFVPWAQGAQQDWASRRDWAVATGLDQVGHLVPRVLHRCLVSTPSQPPTALRDNDEGRVTR
jgi:hypothetical protein